MAVKARRQQHGPLLILRPEFPLAGEHAGAFAADAIAAAGESAGRLALDLGAVTLVDSRGLDGLLDVAEHLGRSGQPTRLLGVSDTLGEVLRITGIQAAFRRFEDAAAAARDLS